MVRICIYHGAICYDEHWAYPNEDVTEIVRKAQTPVTITTCPKCQEKIERMKKFLSYDPNEVRNGQKTTETEEETETGNPQ